LEEEHPGLVLQIGAFTFDVIHIVGNLISVTSQGTAEPVERVLDNELRCIQLDEICDYLKACYAFTGILVDKLYLFLDLAHLDWSLEEGKNTGHALVSSLCLLGRF